MAYDQLPDWSKDSIKLFTGYDGREDAETIKPVEHQNTTEDQNMLVPGDNPLHENAALAANAHKAVSGAASMPVIPPNSAALAGNRNTTVTNSQHIDNVNVTTGSGDPQEIRGAVTDGMNEHVKQLAAQYDDGRSY
jgi:hypothetical protein